MWLYGAAAAAASPSASPQLPNPALFTKVFQFLLLKIK
jgi:hypothetical protein